MARRDTPADHEQLLADAHALQRLAAMPEWAVLTRLLDEHADQITAELCQRGVDPIQTEGLRAELAAVQWLRARPGALQHAVEDLVAVEEAQTARIHEAESQRRQFEHVFGSVNADG
jgi:hypothetical protein